MVVPSGTFSSLSLGLFSVTCRARSSEVVSTEALVLASLADIRRGTPEWPRWGEEGGGGEGGGRRGRREKGRREGGGGR